MLSESQEGVGQLNQSAAPPGVQIGHVFISGCNPIITVQQEVEDGALESRFNALLAAGAVDQIKKEVPKFHSLERQVVWRAEVETKVEAAAQTASIAVKPIPRQGAALRNITVESQLAAIDERQQQAELARIVEDYPNDDEDI